MFGEQLHFLLGICVGISVVYVLYVKENGINENSLHSHDRSLNEINTEIARARRALPREATPEANDVLSMYVCEHNRQRVECEENKVIHLLKASYGRTTLTTCDQNHDKKWSEKCVNKNKTESIVRNKCDGKRRCDILASNSVFGDPCAGTIKYLEVRYICAPEYKPISIHVCEHSNLHMECARGKVIHLLEANYGRTTFAKCTSYNLNWNLNCASDKSEEILKEKCDRKRACDVEAYNSIFGDPCPGTIKYIEMRYRCAPDAPPPTHVCEDGQLHFECYKGSVIQVLQANYGRTSLAKCDMDHNQWNVNCVNNKTKEILKKVCDGKSSCDLTVTNSLFGDPCIGTIKYLEMQYTCVPDEDATTNLNTESTTAERTSQGTNETNSIYACENNNLHLECEEGNGIHTLQANYGRTSLTKCDENRAEPWSVTCVNNKTEEIVRKVCNGKRSCDVAATNSVFGDPCYGTIKYLEVQYLCALDEVARTISNIERVTTERTSVKTNETNSIYVCEDNNIHLECEEGNGIRTLQANYGRTSLTKCDEQRAESWSVNCVNNKTEEIVGTVCNGKRSCDVAATNSVFGDPCYGTIKYLEMQYMCVPDGTSTTITYSEWDTPEGTTPENELISIHVCEDDNLHVECEKGKVIRLLKANYGRTTLEKCDQKYYKQWSVDCVTNSAGEIVRRKCDGKRSCDVAASNYVFGDPCYGTIKYLEVQYLCAPGNKAISVYACENDNLHAECESGHVINLLQANYGRSSLDMCNTYINIDWNVNCISIKSEDIIRDKCNGKRSCDVAATNSVFGDPCYGTIKYLEMHYLCVSDATTILNTESTTRERTTYRAISEESEISYSTNTIDKATTKSFRSVSPTTQNIPMIIPDISKTESNIPRTVSTTPSTVRDYPRTVSAIPRTVSDYPSSVSAILITFPDSPRTDSENPRTASEYSTTVSEYPRADSEFSKTLHNIATETIKYATTIISEETNAPTIELSTSHLRECGSYDLKCFKFECPNDFGSYLHPTSRRMFIVCINWKPTIKTCGKEQVVSEKFMKCVSENHWWRRWGGARGLQPQFRK